jgi:DNA-binding beta-propeller fold protein YncE
MSDTPTLASPRKPTQRTIAWALVFLSCSLMVAAVVFLFMGITASQQSQQSIPGLQAAVPGPRLVKNVVLPSIVIAPAGHAPIQALPIDGFDFQALDPQTGLLFVSHPGPSAAKWQLDQKQLPPGTQFQGQLVVFDTKQQAVVTSLTLPDIHGVVVASDLGRVYAADVKDDRIYVIDERTLRTVTIIPLGLQSCATLPCESPDGLVYDPSDHKIFVSDNGADTAHQDLGVIDVQSNRFVAAIPLGLDRWGDAIGHPQYDPVSHHLYVAVQPQAQPVTPATTPTSTPAPVVLPPAQFVTIDPVSLRVLSRLTFSNTHACSDPHGQVIDAAQRVAFTACVATHTLMMIDLRSMKLFGPWQVVLKPDILRLDLAQHRLYVPGTAGVSIFDEQVAAHSVLKQLGNFVISKGTSHTVEVNPSTHLLYFPVQDAQGRPILRILQFSSQG